MMHKVHRKGAPAREDAEHLPSQSDESLMRGYVEGNEACFRVLIQRYERELYGYLRRVVVDPMQAEDVFQNTFMQVHAKRGLYELGRPFRPWLYVIATNQAIDSLRRNQRHRRASLDSEAPGGSHSAGTLLDMVPDGSPDPHHQAERSERRALVRAAVDNLADHLRMVVVLSYYQGMSYREIAEILQIPVGTVKSRLHVAIQRLGEQWAKLGLAS